MLKKTLLIAALIAGLVPVAFAQLNSTDKTFAMKAAKANNYEIKAANMSQNQSTKDAYKQYAQMIVTDHTQASQELEQAVASADPSAQLPTGVSATGQRHLDALKNAGNNFDMTYRDQMIATHVAALKLFRNYVGQPNDNPKLKQVANKLIPVLQKHLRDAKKLPKQ